MRYFEFGYVADTPLIRVFKLAFCDLICQTTATTRSIKIARLSAVLTLDLFQEGFGSESVRRDPQLY